MSPFGLPNFGQLTEAFKKAQQIQKDAQKLQEELEKMELEGKSENGEISVFLSGNQEPIRVIINESLIKKENIELERVILEACKNAYQVSTSTMKDRMEKLTGSLDLNLPDSISKSE